jgi:O-antigen/teichoic acid export membrane protein
VILIAPLFFLANDLIIFLLGDKWEPTVILFQILLLSIIVESHRGMIGKAILSKGLSKLQFKISLLTCIIRLSTIIVGIYFGINEFAIAVTVSSLTIFLYLLLY